MYNKDKDKSDSAQMQQVINEGLLLLDAAIDSINMNTEVKGPWLTNTLGILYLKSW